MLEVLTMTDNTPPPDVTGAAAAFQNSDLVITYTIPVSEIIKDIEVKIWNAAHTILYATLYPTTNRVVWTAEQNIFATGDNPLKSVSVDIHTRSWGNFLSLVGVNVTATAPLPSTPTGYTSNWISDNGTADEAFITSWLGAANANDYELTIDGKNYYTRDLKFIYSYEQNVADHKPTLASGNPTFVWLLKARDKLGQSSVPVNVTVANAAPPSGVMSITVNPGFATLGVTVGLLASTIVQDFDHFEWRVWNGTSYVRTINSPDPTVIFDLSTEGAGTYTPSVTMVDKFNQRSAIVSGAPTILDVLTIEQLRAETIYTDWVGTAANVLLRLKDGVLYDGSGAYVFYAPNAGWQWLEASRPLLDRYKTVTFSAFWGAGLLMYYEVDTPTGTVYYSGPATINANGSYQLTRYTVLATAQANAYAFGIAGNGTRRFDFTRIEESRRVRMWFKDTVSNTGIYEYYARRLVQSDDIEVESIRSINIAALGINADRIFATSLSAFTASMGSLHIDSLLDIATTGIIFQGTGSGTLAQNAAAPTSFGVTGLKIYQASGIGKLSTYNAGVEQITLDTDGKLKAGAGAVVLDANGIQITAAGGFATPNTVQWKTASRQVAFIGALDSSPINIFRLEAIGDASNRGILQLIATGKTGFSSAGISVTAGESAFIKSEVSISGDSIRLNASTSVGASITPTRNLSIFADNGYISWNNAAGTEKWILGLSTTNSGRFELVNASSGAYPFVVDTSNNIGLGGAPSGGGSGVVFIANRVSAPAMPTGGGVVYVESGSLKFRGSSGTVTTIAPA